MIHLFVAAMLLGPVEMTADEKRLMASVLEYHDIKLAEADELIASATTKQTRDLRLAGRKKAEATFGPLEMIPSKFQTGQVGLLSAGYSHSRDGSPYRDAFKVFQVVDDQNMIVENVKSIYWRQTMFWVTGVSTADITDGGFATLPQVFEVVGTTTYKTAIGGSKTIHKVKPFAIQNWRETVDRIMGEAEAEGKAKAEADKAASKASAKAKNPLRTFTDTAGKFSVMARFVSYVNGKVRLEKEDGTVITVPLDKFSQADQDWLNAEIEKRRNE